MKPTRDVRMHSLASRCRAMTLTMLLALPLIGLDVADAQSRPVPDTFTATTTGMTPAGMALRIQIVAWSDEAARTALVAALARTEDRQRALTELPTLGYLWPSGSGVGYALKYAHRTATADGERITVVTDRPVGAYDFEPWSAGGEGASNTADYTVVELYLDNEGRGSGSMSLAAEVVLDEETATVSLARGDAARDVLTNAAREPKPYWAEDGPSDNSVP